MKGTNSPLAIIPARANSSRFPQKVTAKIHSKPMVQYVWDAACRARRLGECIVATDDVTVAEVVESFGGRVVLTPEGLKTGTDRVAFVARDSEAEIIVNLQADEPLLKPESIDGLIDCLESTPSFDMATLAVNKDSFEDLNNPNIVKVVTAGEFGVSGNSSALYFSRLPITAGSGGEFLKHIGVYAFRRKALLKFCDLPSSRLEKSERLEQLRALEAGFRIGVHLVSSDTIAVDTPEDLIKVEGFISNASKD
jgi:3-deoxy-manno-octulosonate cytidylyltransferase (CMP-KDO synthetase)